MTSGFTVCIERLDPSRDLDAVAALEAVSFTNPTTRDLLEWELANSDVTRIYVLRLEDASVAAYCSCWLVFDELHINSLAVQPGLRRQGLASRLLAHVLAEATRDGARRATLEVRRSNDAARKLYEGLGFVVSGVRPTYYSSPAEDALIFWCGDLGSAARPRAPAGPEPVDHGDPNPP